MRPHVARLAASLLSPGDLLVDDEGTAPRARGLPGRAFCPTPRALRLLRRCRRRARAPPSRRRSPSRQFARVRELARHDAPRRVVRDRLVRRARDGRHLASRRQGVADQACVRDGGAKPEGRPGGGARRAGARVRERGRRARGGADRARGRRSPRSTRCTGSCERTAPPSSVRPCASAATHAEPGCRRLASVPARPSRGSSRRRRTASRLRCSWRGISAPSESTPSRTRRRGEARASTKERDQRSLLDGLRHRLRGSARTAAMTCPSCHSHEASSPGWRATPAICMRIEASEGERTTTRASR